MNWTVEWVPVAQNRLAAIWVSASDRGAITAAANAIDARLQRDPFAESESRTGSLRVTFEAPLGVLFRVKEPQHRVTVVLVWRFD